MILNQDRRLIAASQAMLKAVGAETIYDALSMQSDGKLTIDKEEQKVSFPGEEPLLFQEEEINSLFGTLTLIRCKEVMEKASESSTRTIIEEAPLSEELLSASEIGTPADETSQEHPFSDEDALIDLLLREEPAKPKQTTSLKAPSEVEQTISPEPFEKEIPEEILTPLTEGEADESLPAESEKTEEDDLYDLISEIEEPEASAETASEAKQEKEEESLSPIQQAEEASAGTVEESVPSLREESGNKNEEAEEIASLDELLHHEPSEESQKERTWEKDLENFYPNLEQGAARIELTPREYRDLLKEFITDSMELRDDLDSSDASRRNSALGTLKDATVLLHLEPLISFFQEMEKADDEERSSMVARFYQTLEKYRRVLEETVLPIEEKEPSPSGIESVPAAATATNESIAPPASESEKLQITEEEVQKPKGKGREIPKEGILKDVKTVPIEFSLKIAAEELNLPEDLVLEFVHDFATQGHEYLPVLVEAYENKDLDKLQKTAHMLKGAASNLRIEPMVENLYELQFDNDLSRAPKRIQLFAGQLMSLDHYLEQIDESQRG